MTLSELYDELEKFDWFYFYADDTNILKRGEAKWLELKAESKKIIGGENLIEIYSKYIDSTLPWNTPFPKPERPNEEELNKIRQLARESAQRFIDAKFYE